MPSVAAGASQLFQVDANLNRKVALFSGDITGLELDAIVNAANSSLLGGGGIDGAIHRAAGPALTEECRALHGCKTGQTKITSGHDLPARHVLHTVGPMEERADLLASCYRTALELATTRELRTIAFPCIRCVADRVGV